MSEQIIAVTLKQLRELVRTGKGGKQAFAPLAAFVVLGGFFSRYLSDGFGSSWSTVLFVSFVAGLVILPVVAESFAGEREHRTLETLLASCITDHALLIGKYLAPVLFGWVVAIGAMGGGLAISWVRGGADFSMQLAIVASAAVFALLTSGLVAAVGVHISLRASSVRQAAQTMGLVFIGLAVVPMAVASVVPPELLDFVEQPMARPVQTLDVVLAGVHLFLLDIVLVAAAIARCKRFRLLLH